MDVDFESQLPFLVRNIFDIFEECLMCSIVHEDVNSARFFHGFADDILAVRSENVRIRLRPRRASALLRSFRRTLQLDFAGQ